MQGTLVHTCTDSLKATCLLQEIPRYPSLHLQQEGRQLVATNLVVHLMGRSIGENVACRDHLYTLVQTA
jgi:hypothetical protein